jgi:hypothetical protein
VGRKDSSGGPDTAAATAVLSGELQQHQVGRATAAVAAAAAGGSSGSGCNLPADSDVAAWLVRCSVLLEKLAGGLMAAGTFAGHCATPPLLNVVISYK